MTVVCSAIVDLPSFSAIVAARVVTVGVWGFWFNGAAGTAVVMVAGRRPGQRGARGRSGWLAGLRHPVTGLATTLQGHAAFSTFSAPPIRALSPSTAAD
jgi:hypothetical protein